MKVKEIIKLLEKHNPEHFVGYMGFGQDTGDWTELDEIFIMETNEFVDYNDIRTKSVKLSSNNN